MAGRRRKVRRGRRWLLRGAIAGALTCVAVVGSAPWVETSDHTARDQHLARSDRSAPAPTRVARPVHLEAAYVAPPGPSSAPLGRLRIGRLGVDAPVVAVGWDRSTMAVPNDPGTLGWFEPSARLDDLAGTSLVAGHVSDASDRLGPFGALVRARRGDIVEWRHSAGRVVRFRVVAIQRFPRIRGLPPSLFRVEGPHTLQLVTCTGRVAGPSGVHYADNLVVSAVQE